MRSAPAGRAVRSFEWTYVIATIAAFVFTPELRRLVDWRGNFDPLNAFAVIPLLMLCPIAALAYRRRARLRGGAFVFATLTWTAGFAYAAFVAAAHGAPLQALFAVGQFCLPLTVGVWLMTRDETMEVAHERLARWLTIFGTIAGAYGIFQYIVAPPWDTAWMQNIDAESFGVPTRFGIRVFGVLNGPGVFALFLGAVILFGLPYLRMRNWLNMSSLVVMIVALLLSLVRSAWLAVFVGVAIFVVLSPKRLQAIASLGLVAVVCGAGVFCILLASPDASLSERITGRFTTLSDIAEDPSAVERRATALRAFQQGMDEPAGAGLGLTGGSTKLGGSDAQFFSRGGGPIDNGFVSRFVEMGVPGFAAFVVACCASVAALAYAYGRLRRARDGAGMRVAASCIATQVVIFMVNLSGDDQQALLGVLFFAALALPLMRSPGLPVTGKR